MASNEDARRIAERRAELEAERKRLVTAFTKGDLDEKDLDAHMEGIRAELFTLPVLLERDVEAIRQASLSMEKALADMAASWGKDDRTRKTGR